LRTWSRRSTVIPEFVGHTIAVQQRQKVYSGVHHGKHVGAQAGASSVLTRTFKAHSMKAATETAARPAGIPGGPGAITPAAGSAAPVPKA